MASKLPHLTADAFYRYLKCPHWVYWDIFGDPKEKGEVPPMLQKLREDGVLHEKRCVEKMGAFEELPSSGEPEELFAMTIEAMRRGAPLIYQGTLLDDVWSGRPDLLRRVETPSKFGAWSYEAVDIKSSREITEAQSYQLVFYALLLKKIQGVKPEALKILNVDGEERSMPIDDAEPGFFEVLDRILAIRAGEKPPLSFMSSCKDSPWFALCKREAEEGDDISLLYKIYKSEAKRLREAGYATLTKLAEADLATLKADVKGVSDHRVERLQLQAQALHGKETLRIDEARLPDAEVELHFDIEGDPMIGVEYLHGLLIREGGTDTYKAFAAEDPADEGRAWTEFCDFIEGYAGAPIYHYGWYELDAIRRLSNRYGISRKAAIALDPSNMIDLNRVTQRCVIFPLYFYSLKDVAKHLGFRWRASDASGANSVMWFQEWCEKKDRALFQKIVDYNEDDVRATAHLKDWLVRGE
ncbi:MAG TPA: TM0106 family RecB-like putative nuclease [Candidatus Baltobacteraceae bacterium]|nr:TM0106 family RecB-like putative nuclease [Candidatus Baltobacteraceae bacterium]